MANRLSVKKLSEALVEMGIVENPFNANDLKNYKVSGISNETYGNDSRVYVNLRPNWNRRQVERELQAKGFKVFPKYWPESNVVDVGVSYFKGHRWWE